jgi:ribosome-binding ATPase YchF (GTP1/OBG family)
MSQLSNVDALINVVRAFTDESIPHIEGNLDLERDIATMNLELAFSDLALLERRLERIEISLKGAKQPERQGLLHEQEILTKIKANLEKRYPSEN